MEVIENTNSSGRHLFKYMLDHAKQYKMRRLRARGMSRQQPVTVLLVAFNSTKSIQFIPNDIKILVALWATMAVTTGSLNAHIGRPRLPGYH
jgi:hypothetical protein